MLRKTMLHTPASTLVLHLWAFALISHASIGQTVFGVDRMREHKFGDAGWADGFNLLFHILITRFKVPNLNVSISGTLHVSPVSLGCVGFTLAPEVGVTKPAFEMYFGNVRHSEIA